MNVRKASASSLTPSTSSTLAFVKLAFCESSLSGARVRFYKRRSRRQAEMVSSQYGLRHCGHNTRTDVTMGRAGHAGQHITHGISSPPGAANCPGHRGGSLLDLQTSSEQNSSFFYSFI
ncbi:hypothetical protein OH76DRAFT_435838 [Lentinus brumalis]|uniref:Uncharacterized protein n=1 Tax=Lentinus brumalis TaxID=2498619 RepID=A0A371DDZ5_9APHY|nr:hypothetical protein OH76DRAFT_435838 [Polyporus brumalis]